MTKRLLNQQFKIPSQQPPPFLKETLLWTDKYRPEALEELVIHNRKTKEIQLALSNLIDPRHKSKILVLNGPTGCGKSELINQLVKVMNIHVVEWVNPMTLKSTPYTHIDYRETEGIFEQFQSFINRTKRFNSTQSLGKKKSQIILLDDLPNLEHYETRKKIQSLIRNFCFDPKVKNPLIILSTDFDVPSNIGMDGYELSEKPSNGAMLIDQELIYLGLALKIEMNPVAETFITKALIKIIERNYNLKLPTKDPLRILLRKIAEMSNGDLRKSINLLQFQSIGLSLNKLAQSKLDHFDLDKPIDFFHILRKIFYCKWEPSSGYINEDNFNLDECINEDNTNLSKSLKMNINPELLIDQCNNLNSLYEFQFQNYIDQFNDIEHLKLAIDNISFADTLHPNQFIPDQSHVLNQYSSIITMRGILAGLRLNFTGDKQTAKKSYKPYSYEHFKKLKENQFKINQLKCLCVDLNLLSKLFHQHQSNSVFTMELAPFLAKIIEPTDQSLEVYRMINNIDIDDYEEEKYDLNKWKKPLRKKLSILINDLINFKSINQTNSLPLTTSQIKDLSSSLFNTTYSFNKFNNNNNNNSHLTYLPEDDIEPFTDEEPFK